METTIDELVETVVFGDVVIVLYADVELQSGIETSDEGEKLLDIDDAGHGVGLGTFEAAGRAAAHHNHLLDVQELEGAGLELLHDLLIGGEEEADAALESLGGSLSALQGFAFA